MRLLTCRTLDGETLGVAAGVGAFRTPPRFLGDGDRLVVEIEGVGRLENVCLHETVGVAA